MAARGANGLGRDDLDGPGLWVIPDRLFDGAQLVPGRALLVRHGRVAEHRPREDIGPRERTLTVRGTLTPGFVDLQVNGGGGAMLNTRPTEDGIRRIAEAHRAGGTVAWLPTVITDTVETTERACEAALGCHGRHGVVGVHIEGPHINPLRKGTHDASLIRPFDVRTLELVRGLRERGLPVLLTLAPECVPRGTIARLTELGAVVSAGHTGASATEIRVALDEGLAMFTHLYNAMTPMSSRDPGVVGTAIDSTAWCGLIVDGHHVDDAMCRIAIRGRPRADRTFVVSDAMATVHGPDRFELYGETIEVVDGRLVNAAGSLAGAHIDLMGSVRRLVENLGMTLDQALRMATSMPAQAMGLPPGTGRLTVGTAIRDVLVLSEDLTELQCLDDFVAHLAVAH